MKISIIADSPLLTTGFGMEAFYVASALAKAGHEVLCFGLKGKKQLDQDVSLPFAVLPVDVTTRWDLTLRDFLWQERPELVLILIDLFNLREIMQYCDAASWAGPIWVYLTPDGLPVYQKYIAPLSRAQNCIVTTRSCASYLKGCGLRVGAVIPGGVDTRMFAPLDNRRQLRENAGLTNKFVVGVFGRNCERKQQQRVIEALADLHSSNDDKNVVAYFHCVKRGYWHLDEIATELGVQDRVIFPEDYEDETRGVASRGVIPLDAPASENDKDGCARPMRIPKAYGYVERINCCDLIVNASNCGDFEHIILESQACGIPLAHTDDEGIMTEALDSVGIKLKTSDVGRGHMGEKIFFVDPKSIAAAILSVKKDLDFALRLRQLGLARAQQHPWSALQGALVDMISNWSRMKRNE